MLNEKKTKKWLELLPSHSLGRDFLKLWQQGCYSAPFLLVIPPWLTNRVLLNIDQQKQEEGITDLYISCKISLAYLFYPVDEEVFTSIFIFKKDKKAVTYCRTEFHWKKRRCLGTQCFWGLQWLSLFLY